MPLVFACIAPHGSIAIPEAKPKDRPTLASATTAAMRELGRRFTAAQPDVSLLSYEAPTYFGMLCTAYTR